MMNNQPDPYGQILELLNNPNEARRQINEFAKGVQGDPKAQVEQLISSGQMSQGQYNMLSKFASLFMKFMN